MKISEVRNGLYEKMAEIIYLTTRSTYSGFNGQGQGFNKMGLLLVRISYILSNGQVVSFWDSDCNSDTVEEYERIISDVDKIKKDVLLLAEEIDFGIDMEKECLIFKSGFVGMINFPKTIEEESKETDKEFIFD